MKIDCPTMMNSLDNIAENLEKSTLHFVYLAQNIDFPFTSWLKGLFTSVIFLALFPLMMVYLHFFLATLFLRAYRFWYRLRDEFNSNAWNGARNTLSIVWNTWSWLWNGYEMVGLENIPESKEALLVVYHGAIPLDLYYMIVKIYYIKRRCIRVVAHHLLFKVPGWNLLLNVFHAFTGSFLDCVQNLKEGHIVALAPGGLLEAQFGDEEYHLMWDKRIGFAKVAIEAQVPIIPVFTQNSREVVRTLKIGNKWLRKVYEKTKLPVVPTYGGFPVKLRTYVGEPIPYDPNTTAEELSAKTAQAMENLIRMHQRVPGSILKAMIDRFYESPKHKLV